MTKRNFWRLLWKGQVKAHKEDYNKWVHNWWQAILWWLAIIPRDSLIIPYFLIIFLALGIAFIGLFISAGFMYANDFVKKFWPILVALMITLFLLFLAVRN